MVGAGCGGLARWWTAGIAAGLAALASLAGTGCAQEDGVRLTERQREGQTEVALENNLVRLVIVPSRGGGLSEVAIKEFGLSITPPPPGGLLLDFVAAQGGAGDWSESAYEYEMPEGDAEESSVHVWRTGRTGSAQYITIHKTYTLKRGSDCARVDYRIENDPRAVNPVTQEYVFRATIAGKGISAEYFLPSDKGVRARSPSSPETCESSVPPAKPWLAVRMNPANGDGMALVFDSRDLESFSVSGDASCSTITWRFRTVSIKAGGELAASVYLIPLRGLSSAEKVDSIVSAAMAEKTPVGK